MNDHERDALEQELLELHFGCHPEPERMRARLNEPEVAARWRQVQALADTLRSAARAEAAPARDRARLSQEARWLRLPLRIGVAAAAAVAVSASVWGALSWRAARARAQQVTLTVRGPTAVPDGASAVYEVRAADADGVPVAGEVRWRAVAGDGHELARGTQAAPGTITLAAALPNAHVLEVEMATAQGVRAVRVPVSAATAVPFVHLASDRPIYRPGDTMYVRAVALDRVTFAPAAGRALALRLLDAKAAPLFTTTFHPSAAEHGVCAHAWPIPEHQTGGTFRLQVTIGDASLVLAETTVRVQRFQPPRLHKAITLDRSSYAAGERGVAAVAVTRLGSGDAAAAAAAAFATVRASVLIDGREAWHEDVRLGADGRARFAFTLPDAVERGEGRFVLRVDDGSVVETEVEPFTVPTGGLEIAVYPESGELVAGHDNRVYVEVTDSLGRSVDASGRVLDATGGVVATFATVHRGRGVVTFAPQAATTYTLALDAPSRRQVELRRARAGAVALHALDPRVAAGAPVRVRLLGQSDAPVTVAAFCRGVLVGQATSALAGEADLEVPLPDAVFGVLRVTAFVSGSSAGGLTPVAERLVQRAPARRLAVELSPTHARMAPGGHQTVRVRTTDESGAPVAAAVGLCVADAAEAALTRTPRIGVLDQAMLFADVEALEDAAPFLAGDAMHVDLLLGTRGWRRFVWSGEAEVPEARRPALAWAKAVAGRPVAPHELQDAGGGAAELMATARAARRAGQVTANALVAGLLATLVAFVASASAALARRRGSARPWLAGLAGSAVIALCLTAFLWQPLGANLERLGSAAAPAAFRGVVWSQAEDSEEEPLVQWAEIEEAPALQDAEVTASLQDRAKVARAAGAGEQLPAEALALDNDVAEQDLTAIDARRAPQRTYAHSARATGRRDDFAATVLWQPLLVTDADGRAELGFDVSDRVTTWSVTADAHGNGRVGQARTTFVSTLPFHLEARLPVEVSDGDQLELPVALTRDDGTSAEVELRVAIRGALHVTDGSHQVATLRDGKGRVRVPVQVRGVEPAAIEVIAVDGRSRDRVRQDVRVVPRGFPQARAASGLLAGEATCTLPLPAGARGVRARLRLFPSPLATLREGLDGMLQDPHGCFEQASSTTYPNVLVLSYLETTGDVLPDVAARAHDVLGKGYTLLTGYECTQRGYEWFGRDPGHLALTAYGLLEFTDMGKVRAVAPEMVARTRAWLMAHRDGEGGFADSGRGLHSFGMAPPAVNDAYALFALLHAGTPAADLGPELARARARAATTGDPYELALLACALNAAGDETARAAGARLAAMQRDDGSLVGSTTSITGSGGDDLAVETTALAALAWMDDPTQTARVETALGFVQGKRNACGTFGATQATVLALRALTAYAAGHRVRAAAGTVRVTVGGAEIAVLPIDGSETAAVDVDLTHALHAGDNLVRVVRDGDGEAWPFAADLAYHTDQPADDADCPLRLAVDLAAARVGEGDVAGIDVALANDSDRGLPMVLAVVGLPAGLEAPARVLDDLKQRGLVDFYEVAGREVVFYWRGMAPHESKRLHLDVVARVPGRSTGPASRAYLYYTPGSKRWARPLQVDVE